MSCLANTIRSVLCSSPVLIVRFWAAACCVKFCSPAIAMAGAFPEAATDNSAGTMLIATGGDFGNIVVVLGEVTALDETVENDAVLAADGARDPDPVVIAKGWLPAGK